MSDEVLSASIVYDACVCLGVQRAARALARRYDEALRPAGITSGQFAILSGLLRDAAVPLTDLATVLGVERTTLTRNLAPLEAADLVASAPGTDRRIRGLTLTPAGRARLDAAVPLWRAVQRDSGARLGDARWPAMRVALDRLS